MRCKNCKGTPCKGTPCKGCYYTGKENNPRGRGFCANHEKEGMEMKGKDRKMYIVKGNRWILSGEKKTSPRMQYMDDPVNYIKLEKMSTIWYPPDRRKYSIGEYYKEQQIVDLFKYNDTICNYFTYIIVVADEDSRLKIYFSKTVIKDNDRCEKSLDILKEEVDKTVGIERKVIESIIASYRFNGIFEENEAYHMYDDEDL